MKINKVAILATVLGMAVISTSCRKKGCTDPLATNYEADAKRDDGSCEYAPSPTHGQVDLMIDHMADGNAFAMNTTYVDDFGNDYQFTRAEFYVSNGTYMDMSMNMLDAPAAYALINPNETTYDFGTVIDGHAHMMTLLVGIDSTTNHADPALQATGPLAYQSPSMHWNWNSGYIFIVLEGVVDIDGSGTYDVGEQFALHVGADDLATTTNSLMIHQDIVAGQTHMIHLDLDWMNFLTGIDLSTDNLTHTMNNLPLATTVANNSATVFSVH